MVQVLTQPRSRAAKPVAGRVQKSPKLGRGSQTAVPPVESGSFLSTMAHEMRGPLSAVALSSELLLEDLDAMQPDQVRVLAQRIHRGTLWLQGLIENILCDAAIREDRFTVNLQPCDLMTIIHEVKELLEPLLQARGQALELVVEPNVPGVRADSRRIGQVLVNLLLNASKFSPEGAPVTLEVSTRGADVHIAVADRGCGLGSDPAALFERYYRSEHARQAGIVGTGLGLAIAKSIIEAHGGTIGAEHRRNGGSRFWMTLPGTGTSEIGGIE